MNRLNRYGKALLFLVLAATLVCACTAVLADEHIGAHVWDEGTKILDANCDHPARYKYTCTICGATKEENVGESDMTKHDWGEWIIDKAPTCTEAGERHRECKNNPHHTATDYPKALGHEFEWITVTEATCTATGFKKQVCKRCNLENASEVIPMVAHKPGNWETTKEPTCTQEGEQARKCTVCGTKVETKPLPALGHDWGNWSTVKEPTCAAKGSQERVCKRDSSHKETKDIDPLGHDWGEWAVTKQPTCTEKGVQTRTCKRDSSHKETKDIPATGHDWDAGKVTKQPTWTTPGEMVYTCKNNPAHTKTVKLDSITKPNNTVCAFGPRLRDSSTILYPNVTDLWYMYTPFSVQAIKDAPGSKVEYELVASNTDIVGKVTLSIVDDELTVDYTLASNTIKITYEFFTILNQITDLNKYEPEDLRSLALQRREPMNIQEYFGDDDQLVLYFCSRCDYSYSPAFRDLAYNSVPHQQLLQQMLSLID